MKSTIRFKNEQFNRFTGEPEASAWLAKSGKGYNLWLADGTNIFIKNEAREVTLKDGTKTKVLDVSEFPPKEKQTTKKK